ncbi:unnamed protein product [Protopolystoma xenopodis]|uniref:Dynamin stalk domain-containing protein n=1 Tax=Protopolystoma xenopodis TaxID=117903 RepID=A0A448WKQ9_9PLAT|nr:unnamed protein product [Protopolystoma xenopodis]
MQRTVGARYLRKLSTDFELKLRAMVDRSVADMASFERDPAYEEVLQHLKACNRHVKNFQGRHDIMAAVKDYILSDISESSPSNHHQNYQRT